VNRTEVTPVRSWAAETVFEKDHRRSWDDAWTNFRDLDRGCSEVSDQYDWTGGRSEKAEGGRMKDEGRRMNRNRNLGGMKFIAILPTLLRFVTVRTWR
jgi:hypothetical protein